jgi:thiol-disulfide isomerase/thioredoxin
MKKKTILLMLLLAGVFTLTGCFNNNDEKEEDKKSALTFKTEYEALNGKTNKLGKENRSVTISENNKFIMSNAEEVLKMIENKETFYVYFGSELCPWCRSVIEKADQISRDNDIEKVYYVDIWDNEGNEILRDKYELDENNNPKLVSEGTETYKKLLEYFKDFLDEYTIKDSNGNKIKVGEKRIFAPNFMFVNQGTIERFTDGTSKKQDDPFGKLTDEILEDEEKMFNNFFTNTCTDKC